jgi:RNA polymerase sigma factor (sigma-70 family)
MDELELIRLAKQDMRSGAVETLLLRHYAWIHQLVATQARRARLQVPDREDAEQEAFYSIFEAIRGYNPELHGQPGGSSFRTFLRHVLLARLKDHLRRVRRAQSQQGMAIPPDTLSDEDSRRARVGIGRNSPPSSVRNDPSSVIEYQERMALLEQAMSEMDETSRKIWDRLRAGTRLRAIAAELRLSYDAVKRRWHAIEAHLRVRLKAFRESA